MFTGALDVLGQDSGTGSGGGWMSAGIWCNLGHAYRKLE